MMTPEEKYKLLKDDLGFNPDEYDYDEASSTVIPKQRANTNPLAKETLSSLNVGAQLSTAKPSSMSATEAFGVSAGRNLLPTVAGLGVAAGAQAGLKALGMVPTPVTKAASLLGPLVAGGAAALGTASVQEPVLPGALSLARQQQAEQEHPYASLAGGVAPNLLAFKPSLGLGGGAGPITAVKSGIRGLSGKTLTDLERANLLQTGIGATLPVATEVGQNLYHGTDINPRSLIFNALAGSMLNEPNKLVGQRLLGFTEMPDRVLPQDLRENSSILTGKPYKATGQEVSSADANRPVQQGQDSIPMYPADANALARTEPSGLSMERSTITAKPYTEAPIKATPEMLDVLEEQVNQRRFQELNEKKLEVQEVKEQIHQKELQTLEEQKKALEQQTAIVPKATTEDIVPGATKPVVEETQEDLAQQLQSALDESAKWQKTPKKEEPLKMARQDVAADPQKTEELTKIPAKLVQAMKQLGITRNVQVDVTSGRLYTPSGVEVNGKAYTENGVRRVMASLADETNKDTLPHEIFHHFYDDLKASSNKREQSLARKMEERVAATEEYAAYKKANPDVTPDEYITQMTGEQTIKMIKEGDSSLWRDLTSSLKARFSTSPKMEDVSRYFSSKLLTDAPYNETFGRQQSVSTVNTASKNQETQKKEAPTERQKSSKEDYDRYQAIWREIESKQLDMGSEEFNTLWKESEQIKNRHGGYVPKLPPLEEGNNVKYQTSKLFSTNLEKELDKERPFNLQLNKQHSISKQTLISKIKSQIPKSEYEALKENGFEDFLINSGENVNVDNIKKWISDNGPQVEVKKLEANTKDDSLAKELNIAQQKQANLKHELETLGIRFAGTTTRIYHPDRNGHTIQLWEVGGTDMFPRNIHDKIVDLHNKNELVATLSKNKPSDQDSATARYTMVNPKPLDQMEGAVDILVRKPFKKETSYDDYRTSEDERKGIKFSGNHFGSSDKNIVGWTRGYMETLPDGKKVFHVFELQSDWAQQQRKAEESYKSRLEKYGENDIATKSAKANAEGKSNDTTLPYYESLALKAAIKHAIDNGADSIAISDANTAMLTEGHDKMGEVRNILQTFDNKESARGYLEMVTKDVDPTNYEISRENGKWAVVKKEKSIPQQKGMELHYDNTVPNILRKLTGSEPQEVNFGEHQNAFAGEKTGWDSINERSDMKTPRSDLIIKDNKGNPKTDITAKLFPLDNIKKRLTTGEPFSIYSSKYQKKNQTSGYEANKDRKPTSNVERLYTPVLETIERKGPEGKKLSQGFRESLAESREISASIMSPMAEQLKSLNSKQKKQLYDILYEEDSLHKSMLDTVPDDLKPAYTAIRERLHDAAIEQVKDNQPVFDYATGAYRERGVSDTYFPNIPSARTIEMLNKGYGTQEYNDLKQQYVDYAVSKGKTEQEAEEMLDGIKQQWSSVASEKPSFGAVRLAEGIGLPKEWLEKDLGRALNRYANRFGKDRAWFRNVESKQELRQLLGAKKDPWGNVDEPLPNLPKGLDSDQDVKFAVQQMIGGRIQNPNIDAISRVVNSALLGPLTGVGNVVSSAVNMMKYVRPTEVPALAASWRNINKAWQRSIEQGLNKESLTAVEDIMEPLTVLSDRANTVANLLNKYSGRQKLEELNRAGTQAMAEFVIDSSLKKALIGDEQSHQLLKRLANGKDYETLNPTELATRLAEEVDGTYDIRGLPQWIIDSGVAPFFKLARWNVQQMNNFRREVWEPFKKGNVQPMLTSLFGATLGGLVLQEVRRELTGKQGNVPTFKEIEAGSEDQKADLLFYKFATAAAYAGFAGEVSDLARAALDFKHKNKPQGFTYPLVDFAADATDLTADAIMAIKEGEDMSDVAQQYWRQMVTSHVQAARVATGLYSKVNEDSQVSKDLKATEARNNLRRFNMVTEQPYQDRTAISKSPNPFMSQKEKAFKKEDNLEEAVGQLKLILQDYMEKYRGNPELLKSKLQSLKQNSYQTMPNLERDLPKFASYYEYLVKTKSKEEADKIVRDYIQQNQKNKLKSSLVPSL